MIRTNRGAIVAAVLAVWFTSCAESPVLTSEEVAWCREKAFQVRPEVYVNDCRRAIAEEAERLWSAESENRRLLADTTWVWCSDNREDVAEVGEQLGIGSSEDKWAVTVGPVEFYRVCTTAAEARGGVDLDEPGSRYLAVARDAGYLNPDDDILSTALITCSRFDEQGVTDFSIDIAISYVAAVLGQIGGNDFTAEVLVGAASAAVCPEHAEAVASFG